MGLDKIESLDIKRKNKINYFYIKINSFMNFL